ncbi:unnamed protein product [Rotaria sp. Silwood1]|nr:unnamed protein product [Rotaria sp. Silwood1]
MIRNVEKFHAYNVLPLLLDFDNLNAVQRCTIYFLIRSIAQSDKSLLKQLESADKSVPGIISPKDHINMFGMRYHDILIDNLNNLCLFKINDRSLVSHCDCEFCIVTNDLEEEKDGRFNGNSIRVQKFSSSLCKKIFQMLLGIQFDNYNNIEVTDPI